MGWGAFSFPSNLKCEIAAKVVQKWRGYAVRRQTFVASREATRTVSGERALIEGIRHRASLEGLRSHSLRLGIGDDCAVLRTRPGYEICVTTDFTLEDRHFRRDWHPPESVGHRCLARGLSDLAAMGAEPLAVFLSLAIPARLPMVWVDRFLQGFVTLARRYRAPLAGGDTAESPAIGKSRSGLIVADVVAIGQVPRGKAVLRSGARAGDAIWVTGSLGGAAAELRALGKSPRHFRSLTHASADHPHLYPEPRISVGRRLRDFAHASIDISDGLSTDLAHVCEESHLSAILEAAALPIHPVALASGDPLDLALNGGGDYELLFTVPPGVRISRKIAGVPVHRIGMMQKSRRGKPMILLETSEGKEVPVTPGGWQHFR